MNKCYSELKKLKTFDERFEYLKLSAKVGRETFGYDRYINQVLYRDPRWKKVRQQIIIRDNGNDLGVDGYQINDKIIVHHINPLTIEDIETESNLVFNPENLICTRHSTHNAIHYGDLEYLDSLRVVERKPNDTKLW